MTLDALVAGGPFRRSDAARAGFSRRALEELVASGEVQRVFREVYLARGLVADADARAGAVALVLPTGAAVCRETAAWLHGVDTRPPGRSTAPPLLEVVVPRGAAPVRRAGLRSYAAALPREDVDEVRGIPVTSAQRTVLDLLRWAPPYVGLGTVDAFAHRGLVDPARLTAVLATLRGHRHVARARRLVELCEPATESMGESWMRLRVVDAGLPRPQVQIPVRLGGVEVYRLDAGYEEARVGFEYDGAQFHGTTWEQQRRDEVRRADLLARFGWTVVGVTSEQVLAARPAVERVVAELVGWSTPLGRRAW